MMRRVPRLVVAVLFSMGPAGVPISASAQANGDECDGLTGAAKGLCTAYCEAQNCDEEDTDSQSCEMLRKNFEKQTGSSTFPCDNQTPSATATRTATATATNTAAATATNTPTNTAEATATDTPTGTPTGTATSTVTPTNTNTPEDTATPTNTPDDTATATPTDTAEPTATDTPTGTPTGTVAATATDTPTDTPVPATDTPTPTNTAEPTATDTPTGTPTGTVAATATDTPTDTPEPTATDTPTGTPTGTVAATATDTPADTDTPTETPTETPPAPTETPTDTATPVDTATPTATETPIVCPLEDGSYTLTQVSGGSLKVDGLPAFPFPAGGTIVQDVSAGDESCVHEVVVPFPGGFSAPVFCIPSLGFTVSVQQTGCGVGLIDSDGGSDFTVTEVGDTSSPNICELPHASCSNGADASVQVDVTVGNGAADTCGTGTANAIVAVPVFTTTWLDSGFMCPDPDGAFDPGTDTLIVSFPQTLDFTTDTNSADWMDLDPDGCCIAGAGPASNTNPCEPGGAGGLSSTGTCLDLTGAGIAGADVTTVASGPVGSNGSPLFDLTFTTSLPNEISTAGAPLGATCSTPPTIDFDGTATRCIE